MHKLAKKEAAITEKTDVRLDKDKNHFSHVGYLTGIGCHSS